MFPPWPLIGLSKYLKPVNISLGWDLWNKMQSFPSYHVQKVNLSKYLIGHIYDTKEEWIYES